jgi:hypothetical protein
MICPNLKCGRTVVAAEASRGKIVRCAHCQTLFMVPKDVRTPPATPAAEPEAPDGKRPGR